MAKIVHYCPKCEVKLYVEDEERYYGTGYGCTIRCYPCNLILIGVDISICSKCPDSRKNSLKCHSKFCTIIKYE